MKEQKINFYKQYLVDSFSVQELREITDYFQKLFLSSFDDVFI